MKLTLKKGLDLDLAGSVEDLVPVCTVMPDRCAVEPGDYHGFMPKAEVKEGDMVKVGTPLFHDKVHEDVKIVSPVSGTVGSIVRGDKRKIERVVIYNDKTMDKEIYGPCAVRDREDAVAILSRWGLLSRIRQRPYDIVPDPGIVPRDIFVTALDTAPLAVGFGALVKDKKTWIENGVRLLAMVTSGKVYLSVGDDWSLGDIEGAEMVSVSGRHPAGNAGVQAANISPVNKGEVIWTMDAVTLYKIGHVACEGCVDSLTTVSLTGPEVERPCMLQTLEGASVGDLTEGRLRASDHHVRIISGNVLTGVAVGTDGYLRFPHRQITVIPEGDDVDEFMGWASLSADKMSVSRSFPGHFLKRKFVPDARILGGRRAMIMSGEYDKVLPMDIMAEYLLKAIISRDIDAMEKLGIYEVAPEDFALCEYVDTSKLPLQRIVRDGLDYLRKEID